jgi:stearoyl-CoA desaturase (delta-9 desaturase)
MDPGATRQGFRWWEVDVTYYGLLALSWLGIARDLRPVPSRLREAA